MTTDIKANNGLNNTLILIITINLIICFLGVALPIGLGVEGDALDYRIPLIEWALRNNSYPNFNWTYVSDYPALAEIIMAIFVKLFGQIGYRIVPILAYISFSWASYKIARLFLNKAKALLAALLVMTSSSVLTQEYAIMVDLCASQFVVWACWMLLRNKYLYAGVFAGLALSTRYTQIPVFCALTIFTIYKDHKINSFKTKLQHTLLFGLVSIVVYAPFLIRNIILHANPIYPLFFNLIGGTGFSMQRYQEIFNMLGNTFGFGKSFLEFILLPFRFAFYKDAFDYSAGPYFLMFLPAFAVFNYKNKTRKNFNILALYLCILIFWFISSQETRFLYPAFPLLITIGLASLEVFESHVLGDKKINIFIISFVFVAAIATGKHFKKYIQDRNFFTNKAILSEKTVNYINDIQCLVSEPCGMIYFKRTGNVAYVNKNFIFAYPHVYSSARLDYRNYTNPDDYIENLIKEGGRYFYGSEINEVLSKISSNKLVNYEIVKIFQAEESIYEIRKK